VRRNPLTILGPLFLIAALSGCSSGGGKGGSAATAGSVTTSTTAPVAPPASVTVTAKEYGFGLPAEIEGGVVRMTLQNDGKLKHEAVIVAAGDTPLARLKQDLTPIAKKRRHTHSGLLPLPGRGLARPGGTSAVSTLTLPAGNYVMVCTLTDADSLEATAGRPPAVAERFHFDLGMAVPFAVKTANTAVMPPTDGTILAGTGRSRCRRRCREPGP